MNYRKKYQKGKETPDPTGTTQGEMVPNPAQQEMMKYQAEQGGRPQMNREMRGMIPANNQMTKAAIVNRLMNQKDQQIQMQQAMNNNR
jgi:hypothetical protein